MADFSGFSKSHQNVSIFCCCFNRKWKFIERKIDEWIMMWIIIYGCFNLIITFCSSDDLLFLFGLSWFPLLWFPHQKKKLKSKKEAMTKKKCCKISQDFTQYLQDRQPAIGKRSPVTLSDSTTLELILNCQKREQHWSNEINVRYEWSVELIRDACVYAISYLVHFQNVLSFCILKHWFIGNSEFLSLNKKTLFFDNIVHVYC